MRRTIGPALALSYWLFSAVGQAAPVALTARPLLGEDAPSSSGWVSYLVRVENKTGKPLLGAVEIATGEAAKARAPISLAPGEASRVELTWHDVVMTDGVVRVVDLSGTVIEKRDLTTPRGESPFLFDLSVPSRLAPVLRGESLAVGYSPPAMGPVTGPSLAVTTPEVDPKTGDLALPNRPAGYSSVTLALVPSERFANLSETARQALADWVLAGGTLAVSITRPEDLRQGPLVTLIGGPAVEAAAPASVDRGRRFRIPVSDSAGAAPRFVDAYREPRETTRERARGYTGENLRETNYGAAATYGLGEVHLLAIDPSDPEIVTDKWVQLTMLDLVRHAWDRRAQVTLPHASRSLEEYRTQEIRRVLDPNEGARWAIVASALALVAYALFAGPVNFALARRAGSPLRALARLPIFAAAALFFVVLTGMIAKGGKGKARHLTLVEAGAGMGRAAATRYRAFFASSASTLDVAAYDPLSVLDLVGNTASVERTFELARGGARLFDFVSRPWETMVVREDGFENLGGGVSLVAESNDVRVTNRLGRDLLGVIVGLPDGSLWHFAELRDNQSVRARAGTNAAPAVSSVIRPLAVSRFVAALDEQSGIRAAWSAIETVTGYAVDFWPHDVPVLIAEVRGSDGRTEDAGLAIDRNRTLLRVVGYGGVP